MKSMLQALLCVSLLCACEPKTALRGQVEDRDMMKEVIAGESTKRQVQLRFGSPTSRSSFGSETWYYVQLHKEAIAFLRPEITRQQVIAVSFDDDGVVTAVDNYNKEDAVQLAVNEETTPTEGHSLSFFEQALGNLGRFNTPDRNPSQPRGTSPLP